MPQAARAGLASRGVNGYGEKPLDTWRSVSNDDVGSAKREPVPAQSSAGRGWKIDRTCVKEMGAGHEDSVIVSVQDNGIGLPQDRVNILEPYVTTREKGTGLGLAVLASVVQQHGGTVHAANRESRGAQFTILLPVESMSKEKS